MSVGWTPQHVTVWCDLEGVAVGAPAEQVIAFCKNWYAAVRGAGYEPGLYVGYGSGLNASDLYYKLPFKRYWGAYNLNHPDEPAVRGLQMKQRPYPPAEKRVPGITFQYDEDVIWLDAKGGTPTLLLPPQR